MVFARCPKPLRYLRVSGMAHSFIAAGPLGETNPVRRRVLVTGAAGNIGSYFAEHSHKKYDLRLMVRPSDEPKKVDPIRRFGQIVAAELSELDKLKVLFEGIDTIVHMAANPSPNTDWDS